MLSRFALVGRNVASAAHKNLTLSVLKQARCYAVARTSSTHSSVTTELLDALKEEIDAEKRLEDDNLGGATRPSIPGFQITTNQSEVRLTKTHNNENILVVFNVNHSVDVEDDEGNPDLAPMPVALPPFSIEITKGNERLCFNLGLVETGEENGFDFHVEEFYIAPAVKDGNEDVADQVYASSGKYIDPWAAKHLQSLHDVLFIKFLEERGFTQEFCQQLVNFATHYEHTQYVGLLSKIQEFVSK